MAVTFHPASPSTVTLACDSCGCLVGSSDRDRQLHADWHREREEIVLDLTLVKQAVA